MPEVPTILVSPRQTEYTFYEGGDGRTLQLFVGRQIVRSRNAKEVDILGEPPAVVRTRWSWVGEICPARPCAGGRRDFGLGVTTDEEKVGGDAEPGDVCMYCVAFTVTAALDRNLESDQETDDGHVKCGVH